MKFEQWTHHQNANTANSVHETSLNKKEIIKKNLDEKSRISFCSGW